MTDLTPAYDNKIARKYSARTVEHKNENKLALQREHGWLEDTKTPILCIPTALTEANGGALIDSLLPGILELPVCIVVRAKGGKRFGERIMALQKTNRHRIGMMPDDDTEMRKMLAGSDMSLFACAHDDGELELALRYGCVPISANREPLEDYDPVQETGNAFLYESPTVWQTFAALVRALETFRFTFDWKTIQRHAMETYEEENAKTTEEALR